jgi:hypothetical protein|tara:strand:+ start:1951 stop:2121 length:171 start_codon:yes stop_codon:yes gene_type:complete
MKKPLKRSVEPAWSKVIHNAIGKKPEGRYQIGGGMAENLRICLERIQPSTEVKDEP